MHSMCGFLRKRNGPEPSRRQGKPETIFYQTPFFDGSKFAAGSARVFRKLLHRVEERRAFWS